MDKVLASIPRVPNENVLVGFDTADDAGVYQLTAELALVQTVDFFTPIVDDPFTYGAIAAANSLSDVYAMGGKPISALSILAYPAQGDLEDLEQILKGGAEKMREADCAVVGGHSVADDEIKFGYAVTGTVHPQRVKLNAGARAGDALVFTKRLGTGVISTALKRGLARAADVEASIASMLTLNRKACEAMLAYDVHGCTDVTGFGLLGHAREMALASGVTLEIEVDRLRFLDGALIRTAGSHFGRAEEQSRIRFVRRGDRTRIAAGCRRLALRSADFRRSAHHAAGSRCGGVGGWISGCVCHRAGARAAD